MPENLRKIIEIARLAKIAFGEYKWQIALLTLLGFISASLGGIGINAVIPLFSFISSDSSETDYISQLIKNFFLKLDIGFNLKNILIFIILMFIIKAGILILFSFVNSMISTGYEKKIRTRLFSATLKANWPFLLKQKLGHLEKILMTNVANSRALLSQITIFIMTFTSLVSYTIIALNISAFITLLTFGLGFSLFFFFKPLIRGVRLLSADTEKINRDISHLINENIVGMKTVKVMAADDVIAEKGADYFQKIRKMGIKAYIFSIFSSSLMEPISVIFIVVIFSLAYKFSKFNLASLLAVVYLIKQIFLYITQIQELVVNMNGSLPYVKSVIDYQKEVEENLESGNGGQAFPNFNSLEFKNISFCYTSGKEIIKNVNFRINRGEIIGLIGPSGAGKTTIVDLLLRLFEPTEGEVIINGNNAKSVKMQDWRSSIGYVSQDIFLINDTIANNIRFHDDGISFEKIEKAARMANIHDFIAGCPQGFDTPVGERGVKLSGGQRQRVIIARALARDPKLLILDEATSALDNESENKIKQVIKNLKGKMTVFVIAHRLSTISDCDRLIVLEDGAVIEEGKPEVLLADVNSYFHKVYNL